MIQKKKKKEPESVSVGAKGLMNRTGIGASPMDAKKMVEGATGETGGDGKQVTAVRRFYIEDAEPIGTVPPPSTAKGVVQTVKEALTGTKATVLIDKIAERLAFERTGVRLYEALMTKHEILGGFTGGPSGADLKHIRDEEFEHFKMLDGCLRSLGADPTAMTPSADLTAVESMGIGQAIGDPRTTLAQGLHAILIAEVADKASWELLIDLANELNQTELVERFRKADAQEAEHVRMVRGWVAAHASAAARAAK